MRESRQSQASTIQAQQEQSVIPKIVFMAGQPSVPPPPEIRPYEGLINHWVPSLNKALLNPCFWGGGTLGGRLTSHDVWSTKQTRDTAALPPHPPFKMENPKETNGRRTMDTKTLFLHLSTLSRHPTTVHNLLPSSFSLGSRDATSFCPTEHLNLWIQNPDSKSPGGNQWCLIISDGIWWYLTISNQLIISCLMIPNGVVIISRKQQNYFSIMCSLNCNVHSGLVAQGLLTDRENCKCHSTRIRNVEDSSIMLSHLQDLSMVCAHRTTRKHRMIIRRLNGWSSVEKEPQPWNWKAFRSSLVWNCLT